MCFWCARKPSCCDFGSLSATVRPACSALPVPPRRFRPARSAPPVPLRHGPPRLFRPARSAPPPTCAAQITADLLPRSCWPADRNQSGRRRFSVVLAKGLRANHPGQTRRHGKLRHTGRSADRFGAVWRVGPDRLTGPFGGSGPALQRSLAQAGNMAGQPASRPRGRSASPFSSHARSSVTNRPPIEPPRSPTHREGTPDRRPLPLCRAQATGVHRTPQAA